MNDDVKFCPSCGAPTEGNQAQQQAADAAAKLTNTPDVTGTLDAKDIEENKLLCILSYLGILLIIPFLMRSNSPYVKFHSNQGLILFILNLVISVLAIIPILGWIVAGLGNIVTFVLMILGIVNTVQGKAKELPIIGKFKLIK